MQQQQNLYSSIEKIIKKLWIESITNDDNVIFTILDYPSTFCPITESNAIINEYSIVFTYQHLVEDLYTYSSKIDDIQEISLENISMYAEYHEDILCCYLKWANLYNFLITEKEYTKWRTIFLTKIKTNATKSILIRRNLVIANYLNSYTQEQENIEVINDI